LNRFDKEVQAKFVDLYTKFAPDVEPDTITVQPTDDGDITAGVTNV
jgi:hypothetical protein